MPRTETHPKLSAGHDATTGLVSAVQRWVGANPSGSSALDQIWLTAEALRCTGPELAVDVELAHLQQGSVTVRTGAQVGAGGILGKVGNTGNTSEPHCSTCRPDRIGERRSTGRACRFASTVGSWSTTADGAASLAGWAGYAVAITTGLAGPEPGPRHPEGCRGKGRPWPAIGVPPRHDESG